MPIITFEHKGNFDRTERFLQKIRDGQIFNSLSRYGREGVIALSAATPVDSGASADAWDFKVVKGSGSWSIVWTNSNMVAGQPLVVLLQYGHGTGTGGYVQGRDFINPAMRPIFDRIADAAWKELTSA